MKLSEMEIQMIMVAKNIGTSAIKIIGSCWGKILILLTSVWAILLPIKPLLIIISLFVLLDFILGIIVAIRKKGISHISSSRMRDTLVKYFFYMFLIVGLFLIETHIVDGYYLTSKTIFAIVSGIEMLSITANVLILFPNIPVLKLVKNLLSKEIAKKLEIDINEINECVNEEIN